MRIISEGYRGITNQIERIESGFMFLGHEINKFIFDREGCDLFYANDINFWNSEKKRLAKKVILNLLDIPIHDVSATKKVIEIVNQNKHHTITCISEYVKKQLKEYCGVENSPIIYQPIKHVENMGWQRDIKYLIVGRNADPMKGHRDVTFPAIHKIEGNFDNMHVVGESVGFGHYHGFVDDMDLMSLYARAKYVFVPSRHDGFGLQLVESVVAGATPISYHWHPTAKEFLEKDLIFDKIDDIVSFIKSEKTHTPELYSDYAEKFSGEAVAKRILQLV